MAIERTVKEIRGLTIEEILGKKLQDEQRVYIMVYNVGVEPDDEVRLRSAEKIGSILDRAHRNADAQGITSEEADEAVDEAMRHVRRREPS